MTSESIQPAGVDDHDRLGDKGWVFDIQRYSIQDGPGIRTTVFLKGCPLRCLWCSNPESQKMRSQLFYRANLCRRCYRCVAACPTGATTIGDDGAIEIDRAMCTACGSCVKACLDDARAIAGKLMTVQEVFDTIAEDTPFYQQSNGGVTFSGGEATAQPRFLRNLLEACAEHGLHTCIETSGLVDGEVFDTILEYVDLVLYDFKHMNPREHKKLAGVDNALILHNAERIVSSGIPLIVRVPLIPEHNDSEENIRALAEFMNRVGLVRVDLLPYHRFGATKYGALGMRYELPDLQQSPEERVEQTARILESYGLEVAVV